MTQSNHGVNGVDGVDGVQKAVRLAIRPCKGRVLCRLTLDTPRCTARLPWQAAPFKPRNPHSLRLSRTKPAYTTCAHLDTPNRTLPSRTSTPSTSALVSSPPNFLSTSRIMCGLGYMVRSAASRPHCTLRSCPRRRSPCMQSTRTLPVA
eukprot:353674-Chlamydomonas_euryale.AAC.8